MVSLVDILKMFRGKLVPLVCVTLAVAMLFAGFIFIKSLFLSDYGADMTFYLSHTDGSYQLLTILNSEAFAEKLLLDENGLPPREQCDPADYDAALTAIKAYNEARQIKYNAVKALELYPYSFASIQTTYDNICAEYTDVYNRLDSYLSLRADTLGEKPETLAAIISLEAKLGDIATKKSEYEESTYFPAVQEKLTLEQNLALANEDLRDTRELADELIEKVVAPWRVNKEINSTIQKFNKAINVEFIKYEKEVQKEDGDGMETVEIEIGLFLQFKIASANKDDADEIIERIKTVSPEFVKDRLERLTGTTKVECNLMTTASEAGKMNSNGGLKDIVIFGLIGGILGFVAFCTVVICKNLIKTEKSESPVDETEDIYAEK